MLGTVDVKHSDHSHATRNPTFDMVLADLGKRLNNALGQLSKASVVDDQVGVNALAAVDVR